jgi:SAM-dependent methyltransferase
MADVQTLPPLRPYIDAYLRSRPALFTLIRPQEAALFAAHLSVLEAPVLDFGCGDGFFASLVYEPGALDVGLDLDDSRIAEARASGVYRSIVTYDGRNIPFEDGHFASVISNCVLEHVDGVADVVAEIGRVTRCGGTFQASVMTARWNEYLLGARIMGDKYRSFMQERQEHRNLLSQSAWSDLFSQAGFDVEEVTGYLSPRTSAALDLAHYLSAPSLASRLLTGKWVSLPDAWARLAPVVERAIEWPVPPGESAALFYVLRRR